MRITRLFHVSFAILFAAAGCSNDDNGSESKPDAVNNVDVGGDSNVPDTTVADSGHDSTVSDSGSDTTVADTAVADTTTPDTTPEAVADAIDAFDAACPAGSWRDFSTGACTSCADTPISVQCSDLDFSSGASYWDDTASTVHIAVNPGVAQVTTAVVHYADYTLAGGTDKTADAVITGNDIAAVLVIDAGTTSVNIGSIEITEACGGSTVPSTDINLTPAEAGGYMATFGCAL